MIFFWAYWLATLDVFLLVVILEKRHSFIEMITVWLTLLLNLLCIDDYVSWMEKAPEFALSLLHADVFVVN